MDRLRAQYEKFATAEKHALKDAVDASVGALQELAVEIRRQVRDLGRDGGRHVDVPRQLCAGHDHFLINTRE